jgi:hypothetical protein
MSLIEVRMRRRWVALLVACAFAIGGLAGFLIGLDTPRPLATLQDCLTSAGHIAKEGHGWWSCKVYLDS